MKKSTYQQIIDKVLKPKLVELGFEEVILKDCMKPEVLYRHENLWFSTTWDSRDRFLEINLGQLHWFKDVMPRLIVLGNYSFYSDEIKNIKEYDENYLENVARTVANTIETAIETYHEKYDQIVKTYFEERNKYSTVFINHLGSVVRNEELSQYKVEPDTPSNVKSG